MKDGEFLVPIFMNKDYEIKDETKLSIRNLKFLKKIGEGAFSNVYLVKRLDN